MLCMQEQEKKNKAKGDTGWRLIDDYELGNWKQREKRRIRAEII